MTAWRWHELYPPRGMTLEASTAVMRVLAGRPRLGLLGLHPIVVFELWVERDSVRWLVGIDDRIADRLPGELRAQCPGLTITALDQPNRPRIVAGRNIRFRSLAYPIRTDVADSVTAALLRVRSDLHDGEAVALQLQVGPAQAVGPFPQNRTPLDLLGVTTAPEPDSLDQQAWRQKITEPLFGVRVRTGAAARNAKRSSGLTRPVYAALALANNRHGRVQISAPSGRVARQLMAVENRLRTWSSLVNASELAVLSGWNVAKMELPQSGNAFPPPPAELVAATAEETTERIAGSSPHPATRGRTVRLPISTYAANCHVVAPTGSGKSTMLASWALSEAAAGRSLVVIEPKGDLCHDIMARLPEKRHGDLVVLDPGTDGSLAVTGFNPLRGPRGDAERRADGVLGLFKELFGSAIGPRSSDVLLHALTALARLDDGALTDVMPFLTHDAFRRSVLAKVSDPLVLGPWAGWFDGLSVAERSTVVAPLGNKLRILTARPSLRRMLGQATPAFRLESIFERPTILLVNLNAGSIGQEGAAIVGALLLNQLWNAIQRQTTKPVAQRRVVPVFLDEWQTYTAGLDFADVLARSRGANVPFTVAHQHLDQLSPSLRAATLANARSRFVFQPAAGDSKALAVVLSTTAEELDRLPAFHAVARVLINSAPSEPFEVATTRLESPTTDPNALRRQAAKRYGVAPQTIDDALQRRLAGGDQTPQTPIGVRRRQP